MSERRELTLADYVAIVISPVLIMGLVGSLVFFLLLILYSGEYDQRLHTILFAFVFAIVLIARISMGSFAPRATLYGVVLGVLVWLGLQQFVQFPPDAPLTEYRWAVNLFLMGIIWWCAHRLTWDCTFVDETDDDAASRGVLESAGLDDDAEKAASARPDGATDSGGRRKRKAKPPKRGLAGWWERYERYREEEKRKPHTPGVWVVYFSLAALPIFGLGQSLIPVEKEEQRRTAFWLMVIYVACGLGLLMTTCFMGLRRYLRQRKVAMPGAMTAAWLTMGTGMALVLLLACAVLPRPNAEYWEITRLAFSKQRDASRFATRGDSPGKGQGSSSSEGNEQDKDAQPGSGAKDDKDGSSTQGKDGQGSSQGDSSGGREKQGQGQSEKGQQQSSDSGDKNAGQKDGQEQKQGQQGQRSGSKQSAEGGQRRSGNPEKKLDQKGSKVKIARGPRQNMLPRFLHAPLQRLGPILKALVFIAGALIAAFFVLRGLLRFLANFTLWAKNFLEWLQAWWRGLLGMWERAPRQRQAEEALDVVLDLRPFASYHNPFADGSAERRSLQELLRYSFDALQALARERGHERRDDETPLEFTERLSNEVPSLQADLRRLATLYSMAAYARRLPTNARDHLRDFWDHLDAHVEAPLSV